MLGYLILLFTVVPAFELWLLIKVGSHVGFFNTILIVILTGVAGAFLAKIQGLMTLSRIQQEMAEGRMPAERLIDGIIILCCGLLLLTPGFITDIVGLLGLIPVARTVFKLWLKKKFKDMLKHGQVMTFTGWS